MIEILRYWNQQLIYQINQSIQSSARLPFCFFLFCIAQTNQLSLPLDLSRLAAASKSRPLSECKVFTVTSFLFLFLFFFARAQSLLLVVSRYEMHLSMLACLLACLLASSYTACQRLWGVCDTAFRIALVHWPCEAWLGVLLLDAMIIYCFPAVWHQHFKTYKAEEVISVLGGHTGMLLCHQPKWWNPIKLFWGCFLEIWSHSILYEKYYLVCVCYHLEIYLYKFNSSTRYPNYKS